MHVHMDLIDFGFDMENKDAKFIRLKKKKSCMINAINLMICWFGSFALNVFFRVRDT